MRPEELTKIPEKIESLFLGMQDRIMRDVVRRIKKTGGITSTADYQLERMQVLGNSSEFLEAEIKRLLNLSYPELFELYDDVVNKEYVRNQKLYEQINAAYIPYEKNETMQNWVGAVIQQTEGELENITASLGFSLVYAGKRVFTPFSKYYQEYLDRACMDIVTGAFDYNTVLRRVVTEMTNSGIRTVDYASGRSNRIDVAARRAVLTGVHQLSAKINEQVAKELGTDSYEVTWHSGHRPTHWWGGRVYTRQQLVDVCRLGEVTGLCGANCRHSYYAFVPGISVRTYTDEQLEDMEVKEQKIKVWNGREYNVYQATQKQRQMETAMRAQREKVQLLKDGGADKDVVMIEKAKYQGQLDEYARFSKKMGLKQERERIYYDMRGRIAPNKAQMNMVSKISSTDNLFEKSRLSGVMGVDRTQIDFGDMDEKSKKSLYNGIKKVFDKFPQLKGHTRRIIYDPNLDAIASSDSLGGVLKFSKRFCDFKQLAKDYARQTKFEWNPKGTTADSIVVHELGHQLDGFLTLKSVFGGQIGRFGTIRTSVAVEREVLQRLGYYDYIRAERASWRQMGYKGRELNDAVEFSRKEFIKKHISEYADKNEREFFAECFSEYMTSKNPRKAARIFGEILEEIMEGIK